MAKPGLYANINKRKKSGTSRSKSKSTISPEAYANMKAGFPKSKKKTAMGGGMMMKKKPKMKTGSTVKPDYLDMDKDGDTEEPMKTAIKQKDEGINIDAKTLYGGKAHGKKKK